MSANNAPGEVDKERDFDSPNLSPSEDEYYDTEEGGNTEGQKKNAVKNDGDSIKDKEIKYKAEDIKKKEKMNFFVNVEGSEARAKAAAKRAEAEKRAAEKEAAEEEKAVEKKVKEEQAKADKKLADEKRHLDEVNAFLKKQKDNKANAKKKEQIATDIDVTKLFLLKGWRKYVTIGVVLVSIVFIALATAIPIIWDNSKNKHTDDSQLENVTEEYKNALDILESDDTRNAFENYDFESVDRIFSYVEGTLTDDNDIAYLYIKKARTIQQYDRTQRDRIYAAAEKAYIYGGDDENLLYNLYEAYNLLEDTEKAEEILEKYDALSANNSGDEDTEGEG